MLISILPMNWHKFEIIEINPFLALYGKGKTWIVKRINLTSIEHSRQYNICINGNLIGAYSCYIVNFKWKHIFQLLIKHIQLATISNCNKMEKSFYFSVHVFGESKQEKFSFHFQPDLLHESHLEQARHEKETEISAFQSINS